MKHSDKNQEFDNMFKDAFEGFEMEPSERVWMGVEKELDKNKKGIVVTWVARLSIAASVLLVMSVGLYQLNFFGNDQVTNTDANFANANENKGVAGVDSLTTKKVEKNIEAVQPISNDGRLVDVVEIKSRTTRSSKGTKKASNLNTKLKTENRTQEEKEAIELLKSLEDKVETHKTIPVVEPETKRPVIVKPVPVPSTNVASNSGSKTEVGVVEMLNYVAKKVSGDDETKLVAVNENKKEDGSVRKRYEVDLGVIKFSRTKNTNR